MTLGENLKHNRRLQILTLQRLEKITVSSLKTFVMGLQENCHLRTLYLYETAGGAEAVQHESEVMNKARRQRGADFLKVRY